MDHGGQGGGDMDKLTAASGSSSPIEGESIWPLNWRASEVIAYGSYPQRPGAADCAYYIRTGLCRFGMTCKFNHPLNRKLAAAAARIIGGYPERVGQPECQYYLKTGTCKYGVTCKFHHPRDMLGIDEKVQLNWLGYPLRPNEAECAYYLRTGECKFGNTCKFHHPQPADARVLLHGSPIYSSVNSNVTSGQQTYPGGLMNWPLSRASIVPSSRWPASSSYAHLVVPQEMVQVSSWNTFTGQSGGSLSPQSPQQVLRASQFDGTLNHSEISRGDPGIFAQQSGSVPWQYAMQMENIFPERPDQPVCQFYMKTGDCKFGTVCRFHHPRERLLPAANCVLSPLGLPLRDGEPLCVFYSRYGICKFGPTCKFDHPMTTPMGILAYGLSTSSAPDVPIVQRILGSLAAPPAMTSSERPVEAVHLKSRRLSVSDSTDLASHDEATTEAEGSHGREFPSVD